MEDVTTKAIPPSEEDPVIHRYLTSLREYSPSPSFEDRVMARVFTPAPLWWQGVRNRCRAFAETGRVWWLLGGLTGAYAVSLALTVGLVALNSDAVGRFTGKFLVDVGLPVWRSGLGVAAGLIRQAYTILSTTSISGPVLVAAATSLAAVLALNSWLLYRLMQPGRIMGIGQNASR